MKQKILLTLILSMIVTLGYCQQNAPLDKWNWILGEWIGEGSGTPGEGKGFFTFEFDLDKNIVVRKSHSEYSATNDKPKIIHDDLMVVFIDQSESNTKAIYFDNESHVINYSIIYTENSIVLTSKKIPNMPIFRLTYTLIDQVTVDTKFEMSQDGINFMVYVQGKSKKTT